MKKEFKTLKDLDCECNEKNCQFVDVDELKAEAIKWVKEEGICKDCDGVCEHDFLEFHNITEEDLK